MESSDRGESPRKRRTRAHVIEDLSENHLERKVLLHGHVLRRPARDYGEDVTMFHFADTGEIENGEIRFQLKATDSLTIIKDGSTISFPISTRDLRYWALEIHPLILVVFDANAEMGYWLHIQEYAASNIDRVNPEQETVNVHIPIENELTEQSIDAFRKLSLDVVDQMQNRKEIPDGTRKPR